MSAYEFDALIIKHADINAGYIEFPYDVEKEFNTKGRVKVAATFDGLEYRGSLVKMGYPCHILGLTQEIRRAIGKHPGDTVHVVLRKDEEPRIVDVPADFAAVLEADAGAKRFFDSLSYTSKKEYITWITDAKRPETRANRMTEAIGKLGRGEKLR